jgi:hypothetical protein
MSVGSDSGARYTPPTPKESVERYRREYQELCEENEIRRVLRQIEEDTHAKP